MYMPRFNAEVQEPEPKEEAPMNTTSTVTPINENPKQPQQRQTAKELIAANVQSLIEQLEAGLTIIDEGSERINPRLT